MPCPVPARRSVLLLLALLAALTTPATSLRAQGAAPDSVHACYVPGTGVMYRIKATNTPAGCLAAAHVAVSWNAQGLVGVTGATGATGVTGPTGIVPTLGDGTFDLANPAGFVAVGTVGSGPTDLPVTGAGTRLMWNPHRAAFRAGQVEGTEWNTVGDNSVAMGFNTTASAPRSTALGDRTTASNFASTALGIETTASGERSTALGWANTASGAGSTAMGQGTIASGVSSTTLGESTKASATASTAMGRSTTASGESSTAMGDFTTASGTNSTAMGNFTTASGTNSTAMGRFASTNGHAGSFVYGDNSGNLSAIVTSTAANQFTVRAAGGVRFFSNSTLTAGVTLAAGGGAWASVSDRNRKQDFTALDGESVLARIRTMPVPEWSYIAQGAGIRHVGPMAQDFYAAFQLGTDSLTITTSDIDGINMLAVQALIERTETLQAENAELRTLITTLMRRVEALEKTP